MSCTNILDTVTRVKTLGTSIARLAVLLTTLLAVAAALANSISGATHWAVELFRYVPYLAWLVPAVLALGLSLWLGCAWRIAATLALALVVGPVMGLHCGRADAGYDGVRFMTFNIKSYLATYKFGGFAEIVEEIERHNPDVLVMQDAQSSGSESTDDVVVRLKRGLAGRQVYAAGELVVASRFPMRNCHTEDLSFGKHERQYVRCTVRAHGTDIDVVTAHFDSPRNGLNATRHERLDGLDDWRENFERRIEQAGKLVLSITERPRPLIVAGDLNAPESSPVVQALLQTGLRDAFSSAGTGYGFTHGHSLRPGISFLRIDHILVSADIGVKNCFVGEPDASDHRPVIADLWMSRGEASGPGH